MPTGKNFLTELDKSLSEIPETRYRAMMGEYVLYYRDKVIGGFYDDRLLVKPVNGLHEIMPAARLEIPYAGAKPMLLIENYDKDFLLKVFGILFDELPSPKPKKKK